MRNFGLISRRIDAQGLLNVERGERFSFSKPDTGNTIQA
jgi:hypothetical protein